jgi:FKBP-type peptidyl-prolyl cis-trans isomerase
MLHILYLAATIQVAPAQPPNVVIRDIVVGQGSIAQTGQIATVQFEVRDKNGKELANTWKRGLPYSFVVGGIQTAPFWSLGLNGMKVGGQRMLDVKPGAGYGTDGVPPVVGPGSELVVKLELVEVKPVKPAAPVK